MYKISNGKKANNSSDPQMAFEYLQLYWVLWEQMPQRHHKIENDLKTMCDGSLVDFRGPGFKS